MALRLTTSSITTGPPSAAELAAQATALLATGDTDGTAGCLSGRPRFRTRSVGYHARVTLLETGLGAAAQAPAHSAAKIFLAIAHAGTALVEADPPESRDDPRNYAGVALYELWSLDAAAALFQAALRLDPELAARRAQPERDRAPPPRPAPSPSPRRRARRAGELAKRAKRDRARARPADGLR